MYTTRQQRRKAERAQDALLRKVAAFRKASPMAEEVYHQGYEEGWKAACRFCMKTCYAASVLALRQLEKYGHKRNRRFLRLMDDIVCNSLSSEEIIDEALQKAGVAINFSEPFNRVEDA